MSCSRRNICNEISGAPIFDIYGINSLNYYRVYRLLIILTFPLFGIPSTDAWNLMWLMKTPLSVHFFMLNFVDNKIWSWPIFTKFFQMYEIKISMFSHPGNSGQSIIVPPNIFFNFCKILYLSLDFKFVVFKLCYSLVVCERGHPLKQIEKKKKKRNGIFSTSWRHFVDSDASSLKYLFC